MLQKPNKLQLNREKMIEREELNKLNQYNPFGKSGAGAPIKDHMGNIIATRRTIANDSYMYKLENSYANNGNENTSFQQNNTLSNNNNNGNYSDNNQKGILKN